MVLLTDVFEIGCVDAPAAELFSSFRGPELPVAACADHCPEYLCHFVLLCGYFTPILTECQHCTYDGCMTAISEQVEHWNKIQQDEADRRHAPILHMYQRGMKQNEIARALDVTEGWVSRVLKRARERGLLE